MNTDTPPRLLDAATTLASLPFEPLVDELARAALELAAGRIRCPPRLVVPMAEGALLLSMAAVADDVVTHKLITVTPANALRGLPTIRGQVSVLDPADGGCRLLLDGPGVTGRRTAALSMLGLRVLWPQGPRRVLLIGTGTQARHHVDALAALYPGVPLRVRGSAPAKAVAFCARWRALHPALAPDAEKNHDDDFDVVITCTTSREPVYTQAARADRLLIAVGSFQPQAAEIGAATVRGSRVFVDDPAGAEHEAGDILQAGLPWAGVRPLADALRPGAAPPGRPLLLKTVGCAAWDLAAARVALAARA